MVRLSDGRLAMVGIDGTTGAVDLQIFNADFSATTQPISLTPSPSPLFFGTPRVAALSTGGYALGWSVTNLSASPPNAQLSGQVFGGDGTPVVAPFAMGGHTLQSLGVSTLSDGSLLYYEHTHDWTTAANSHVIYHVSTTGTVLGSATLDTSTNNSVPWAFSGAVGLAGGGVATAEVLSDRHDDGTVDYDLMVRAFDQNLVQQRQTLAFTGHGGLSDAGQYDLKALSDGGFVLEYTDRFFNTTTSVNTYEDHIVFYNADGTTRGGDILLSSAPGYQLNTPKLAVLSGGNVVAIWEDDKGGVGLSSSHIYGQLFDPQGNKIGQQFTVADAQIGGQAGVKPAGVVALDNNEFAVNFVDTSPSQFSGGTSVYVVYNGTINTAPPSLAITSAGGLVASSAQTIAGTIDVADAGLAVSIYDGATLLGTVTPAADGTWSKSEILPGLGFHAVTAQATNGNGTSTSMADVFVTVASLANPILSLTASQLAAVQSMLAGVATPYTVALTDTAANVAANTGPVGMLITSGHAASITRTGITGQAYSSYEDDYRGSTYAGSRYFFTGVTGQPYTAYEQDIDPAGRLSRILFTGVSGQAYSSYEYDYAANGALSGSKYFYTNVTGQPFSGYELDLDPSNRVTLYAFTGVTGQAYSAYEYDYSAGTLTGSRYFFTNVTGQPYTGYELDLDPSNRVTRYAFTGVTGQAYSAYEYDYSAGTLAGSKYFFTNVTGQAYTGYEVDLDALNRVTKYAFTGVSGQAYSGYEYDYAGGLLVGTKYFFTNVTGQPYTGYELDLDPSNRITKYAFTGVSSQAYAAYEYDYAAGAFTGSKYFYSNIAGQAYSGYETDLDAANHTTRQVFTGVSGQPYSSYEYDYANGALTGSKYQFTNIMGQTYASYETDLDASGGLAMQILDNNDGGHRIVGFENNLTLNSIANDTITGGGTGETFAFTPGFGHAIVTDFYAHLVGTGHDTLQFSVAQFGDANALLSHAANASGDVLISAANGDQLTLLGVQTAQLQANQGDFKFS
jgi:hypothetical protein